MHMGVGFHFHAELVPFQPHGPGAGGLGAHEPVPHFEDGEGMGVEAHFFQEGVSGRKK